VRSARPDDASCLSAGLAVTGDRVHVGEEGDELLHSRAPELVCPLLLDGGGGRVDEGGELAASGRQTNDGAASIVGVGYAAEVAAGFEAGEEMVHRLLGDDGAVCEFGRAAAVGTGTLEHVHVSLGDVVVAVGLKLFENATADLMMELPEEAGKVLVH
jgi:hypothetical protein